MIKMSKIEQLVVDKEVQTMLKKGVLREINPMKDQFVSKNFVRPKKEESKFRPIINLIKLNLYLPYLHFKMEGLKNVKDLLNQGDYMIKIDLRDAYYHIPIHEESQKYLRFKWGKNYTKC